MFKNKTNPIASEAAPWGSGQKPGRQWIAALVLGFVPLATHAGGGITYTHAEISVGFPNGQITFGKTWEDGDRQVTVVETSDSECQREEEVVIEKRVETPRKVIIIEKREPEVVVIERRVAAPRRVVVVHEEPRYRHQVRYVQPRHEHVTYVTHEKHGSHHGNRREERHIVQRNAGPSHHVNVTPNKSRSKDLFGSTREERPNRERGVQHNSKR